MVKTPIEKVTYIEHEFKEYTKDTNTLGLTEYSEIFKESLEDPDLHLLKGPYISKELEFESGMTLEEMTHVLDGNGKPLVNSNILKLGIDEETKKKLGYKLRKHQETAIERIHAGHNLIITTGTGSGKTESFLYPIINEILNDPDISIPGIRAIMLFPMNALVNDQFDRVRHLLGKYPSIKYGFYTGETPNQTKEDKKSTKTTSKEHEVEVLQNGNEQVIDDEEEIELFSNELMSRQQIRENPPHILFTNYSMLEYLLLRPGDQSLLDPANTEHWKFIVLDEAHTYKGALAIEIGMLLRRLQNRIHHNIQFILTSATLGVQTPEGIAKIQEFGKNLTSKEFMEEDIIFSTRKPLLDSNARFQLTAKDYLDLYENLSVDNIKKYLVQHQINFDSGEMEVSALLYDLMIRDENLYRVNRLLDELKKEKLPESNASQEGQPSIKAVLFTDLENAMTPFGVTGKALANLIDLICKSFKHGVRLLDLKYHSFIRSLSGAYITLGDNPKLSLERKTEDTETGKRYFEIGTCRHCNATFIIGVIKKGANNKERLFQNGSIDIYADYDPDSLDEEENKIKVDYFITKQEADELNVEITDKLVEYSLCTICGALVRTDIANPKEFSCEHDSKDKIIVYKVEYDDHDVDDKKRNNLCKCPCCHSKNNKGVVKSINMGRDEATALLTQIYFEALDNQEEQIIDEEEEWNPFDEDEHEEKRHSSSVKQILAFSDSRQQASAAVYFAENNHHRLLRKRLLVEMLENNNYQPITFPDLRAQLSDVIERKDLFDNNDSGLTYRSQADITILFEIFKVDGIFSGEGLGLFYFDYDYSSIAKYLLQSNDQLNAFLKKKGIAHDWTIDEFLAVLNYILNVFRITPAVHTETDLTPADREKYFRYRSYENGIKLTHHKDPTQKYNCFRGLISTDPSKMTNLEKYISLTLNVKKQEADLIVEKIFKILTSTKSQMTTKFPNTQDEAYQLKGDKFILHHYTDAKWYYCESCKKITRFNINDICPHCLKEHSLNQVDPNLIFANNVYRQQYQKKKIEKLVYKEHTAQISNQAGKQRQEEFKKGEINYLSSSTTFEMGIDIGALENVFMRNVPPSPANYVQRAGRAGRGSSNSAFVLTYCSSNSHDYNFFLHPDDMVNGICPTPVFTMENRKVITRHLLAASFSKYFSIYPGFFSTQGDFFDNDRLGDFINWLLTKDPDLIEDTDKILKTTKLTEYENGAWIDDQIDYIRERADLAKAHYNQIIEEFERRISPATEEKVQKQIKAFKNDDNLIGALVDAGLLPKYGFPTDVVELKIAGDDHYHRYNLSRDLKIAVSEYAPGSEVMVDKTIYQSKYINLYHKLVDEKYYPCECEKCHKIKIFAINSPSKAWSCSSCNHLNAPTNVIPYVKPKFGFTATKRDDNTNTLPKRTYSSPIQYVGNGHQDGTPIQLGNIVEIASFKDDELLILNNSNFYACPVCGFTKIINNKAVDLRKECPHKNVKGSDCNGILEKIHIGYQYKTDVLKVSFNHSLGSYNTCISTLYALLEGIAIAFDIERTDIDGIYHLEGGRDTFILFDSVPGGAGHVKRLMNKDEFLHAFHVALEITKRPCCDTACYKCLKNYYNQKFHQHLEKTKARAKIEMILNSIENPEEGKVSLTHDLGMVIDGGDCLAEMRNAGDTSEEMRKFETIADWLEEQNIIVSKYTNDPSLFIDEKKFNGTFGMIFNQMFVIFTHNMKDDEISLFNEQPDYLVIDTNMSIEKICDSLKVL